MKKLICIAVVLACGLHAFAQPVEVEWHHAYGGTDAEWLGDVKQTSDGGYIISGHTMSVGAGMWDFWLVKTDSLGTQEWSQSYGADWGEFCESVIQTSDGGYALAGSKYFHDSRVWDFWIVRVDSLGNELWNRSFGGVGWDMCYSMLQTDDGGFLLAGRTESFAEGLNDFWLVKINPSGNVMWNRTYGNGRNEWCYSLIATSDLGYALAGTTTNAEDRTIDVMLLKLNSNCDSVWSRSYGGGGDDICNTVMQTPEGGFFLAGTKNALREGADDFWLKKTDESGNELWHRSYGGDESDICNGAALTHDGGCVLIGSTRTFGDGFYYNYWVVRVGPNGDSLWSQAYGDWDEDFGFAVQQTADSGYVCAGLSWSHGSGLGDYWLVKTGPDLASSVTFPNDGAVPERFSLAQNFPNPFNSTTMIEFTLPTQSEISLTLHNVLGEYITTIAEGAMSAGSHRVTFEASELPSGSYFYQLEAGEFRTQKQMVLVK